MEKNLYTLEFHKVREMLAACTLTEGGRKSALSLMPADYIEESIRREGYTMDARRLLDTKGMPSFGMAKDITDACERAEKGGMLNTSDLLAIADILRTSRSLLDYIRTNRVFETSLDEIFERLLPNKPLEDKITRAIISEEMIADEASPALGDIRRHIRAAESRIKEVLQKYITGPNAKYLRENIVTLKNGRYVIPVKAECKNDVRGLVHDTSATGSTLFVEPSAVVDANNEIRILQTKEEHEIERILRELSASVAVVENAIRLDYLNIIELSLFFGCGELSRKMDAVSPHITSERVIKLVKARHPLIERDKVVPIDVSIGGENGSLIITGPNTGGKTVTLKTLGLFALMARAGLHIPADEASVVGFFDNILVDIGDEQSIEQSLSTFSSHMVNIVSILNKVGNRSLVLFDELGGGTDPVEGAALAVAIIDHIREKGALCAATTHYSELKAYALDTPGVCNASCEFDVETLRPTYRLIVGTPGKSNAFAISGKLGLPREIIDKAKNNVSAENRRFEDVIAGLEKSRIEMERKLAEAMEVKEEYERRKRESDRVIAARLRESEKALEAAHAKASAMVESAKASSTYIFAQLDEVRKKQEKANFGEELDRTRRAVRDHIRENEDKYNPVAERKNDNYVLPRPLRKGDTVLLVDIGKEAVVLELPDSAGNVQVQAGIIKTRTKLKNLRLKEDAPSLIDKENKRRDVASIYKKQVASDAIDEIDLRGMMGDEAWLRVDKYLDEAMLSGFHTVHLIHGKGTGALKNALWQYLKGDRRIRGFRLGRYGEGDGGVTVVELK